VLTTPPAPSETAVILLSHGSKRTSALEDGMRQIQARVQQRLPRVPVTLAFFEFLEPTLEELVGWLASQGIRRGVVMPYFLFAGKEVRLEIPEEIARVQRLFPQLRLHQARDIDVDQRLIAHVASQVRGALRGICQYKPVAGRFPSSRDTGRLGVVLCNRGSRQEFDPGDRLRLLCWLLRDELGGDTLVEPAQAEYSVTTIEVATERLIEAGAERVVVVPYLNFPGKVLFVNVAPATQRAQAEHPGVPIYLAPTLCVNQPAIEICVERVLETGLLPTPSPMD
jgi:sirohydrochlorin cobaltochelatase